MKILLVEDNIMLAETTAILLQSIGNHQVYITDKPKEVFQQCETGNVDVVMMDVNLSGAEWEGKSVSGADLSYSLKTQLKTANIPIVLITAYALESEQKHLLEISKADSLYAKPILDFNSFINFMDKLVNEKGQ